MAERRTAKARVLEVMPEARAVQDYISGWWRIRDGYQLVSFVYLPTARQAWADAASKLTKGK